MASESASDPRIRVFRNDDEAEVIALWQRVFPDDPPWNEPRDVIRLKVAFQPEWFFVCECEGAIAGTVLAGYDGVRGWVQKVAVHPDFRRRGIAALLMSAAEDALAAVGCPKVNLQARAGNDSAVAFYLEAGYTIEDRVSMGKRLTPG